MTRLALLAILILGCEEVSIGPPAPPSPDVHVSRDSVACVELYRLPVPAGEVVTIRTAEAWMSLSGPGVIVRCQDGFVWETD